VSSAEQSTGRGPVLGAGAVVLAVLCCFAGPATIGSTLGVAAAIVCAALVAVAVALLLRRHQGKGAAGC